MNKILLIVSALLIVIDLIIIAYIISKKKSLKIRKNQIQKQESTKKRYIIPIDEYIANQEKYEKGGWRF